MLGNDPKVEYGIVHAPVCFRVLSYECPDVVSVDEVAAARTPVDNSQCKLRNRTVVGDHLRFCVIGDQHIRKLLPIPNLENLLGVFKVDR